MQQSTKKAIIVKDQTRLEGLKARFNTTEQAKFYLRQAKSNFLTKKASKLSFSKNLPQFKLEIQQQQEIPSYDATNSAYKDYEDEHKNFYKALDIIKDILSKYAKVKVIDKSFLPSYIFDDTDIVVVVGRDGLVANTAKYVSNIPIIGVNPDATRYDGILLPYTCNNFEYAIDNVFQNKYNFKLESLMPKNGKIFSDGIETDFLQFNSGAIATINIAQQKAKLVVI